jgi:hypothetical protein
LEKNVCVSPLTRTSFLGAGLCGVGLVSGPRGRLGGDAEADDPPTESDCAHCEPAPAERQTGDHIRQPMHVEQHAARGHRDAEPDR